MSKVIYLNGFGQVLLTLKDRKEADPDYLHQLYYDYTGSMITQSEYEFDGDNHVIRIIEEEARDTLAKTELSYIDILMGY
jgi:hypothetical protein